MNADPGAGNGFTFYVPLTNHGVLNAMSGAVQVTTLTNLTAGGTHTGTGTLKVTGGELQLPRTIVTNSAGIEVVSGSITASGVDALPALRNNTASGTWKFSQSVSPTGPVTNAGIVQLLAGTFQPTSTYTQSGGTTTVASGATLRGGSAGTGAIAINGGILAGVGNVVGPVSGNGTVRPGGSAGTLTHTGNYTNPAAGKFSTAISGPSVPGSDFGKMTSTGTVSLAGTLEILTAPGYFPPVGTTYTVLTGASRTGTFSSVTGQDLSNQTWYDVSYTSTSVVLTVRALPTVSVGALSVTEGNSGSQVLNIPVSLSAAQSRTVTVDYTTSDGTATSPSDFTATNGTLTFTPGGATTINVPVTINGDTTFEPNEAFTLVTSNAVNAIAASPATQTINNDDDPPILTTVTSVSPNEIGQGAQNKVLLVNGSNFQASSTASISSGGITYREPAGAVREPDQGDGLVDQ